MRVGGRWDEVKLTAKEEAFLRDYVTTDVPLNTLRRTHKISGTLAAIIIGRSQEGIEARARRRRKSKARARSNSMTARRSLRRFEAQLNQMSEHIEKIAAAISKD